MKNFIYYIVNFVRYICPKYIFRFQTNSILSKAEKRKDFDYILDRVNYYNKLNEDFSLETDGVKIENFKFFPKTNYSWEAFSQVYLTEIKKLIQV